MLLTRASGYVDIRRADTDGTQEADGGGMSTNRDLGGSGGVGWGWVSSRGSARVCSNNQFSSV